MNQFINLLADVGWDRQGLLCTMRLLRSSQAHGKGRERRKKELKLNGTSAFRVFACVTSVNLPLAKIRHRLSFSSRDGEVHSSYNGRALPRHMPKSVDVILS